MPFFFRAIQLFVTAGILASTLGATTSFEVIGTDPAPWQKVFSSIGISPSQGNAPIVVAGSSANVDVARLANDHIVIVEGDSPLARQIGITPRAEKLTIRHITDSHAPKMEIIWDQPVTGPMMDVPNDFQVFARERWKDAPVLAGKRTTRGAILWLATPPGPGGADRYPYLLQSLVDLGLTAPVRSSGLWAFFDSSYRLRADTEYLAKQWRQAGISALHVAAWHNVEPDPQRDDYLRKLIEACHRNAILVYAWVELPHVSDRFWADHPEWREKTALGQDAELDWRKLMNLQNPQCQQAVSQELRELLQRFDWDGINLAELYFESLEGASNPSRFTPMNDDVRHMFEKQAGFDPKLLFDPSSAHSAGRHPEDLRRFLDFRADLASRMQAKWLDVVDEARGTKPWLDVVLTHLDDRLEPGIRDALGADIARSLPFISARHATLLVEDPATLWDLGASRYAKMSQKYGELISNRQQIAVDINVVERYQDVYPTKKQTGTELFQLVHQAAASFPRVALYFENSLEKQDLELLPAAASTARISQPEPDELMIDGRATSRVQWNGNVEVDGQLWPIQAGNVVLLPSGKHRLTPGFSDPAVRLSDFNGEIRRAIAERGRVDLSYRSNTRAIARLATPASAIEVDGQPYGKAAPIGDFVMLPAGQHIVSFVP